MNDVVKILDASGKPMQRAPLRPAMLNGGGNIPFDAADIYGDHVRAWQPYLWSVDGELNPYRDRIVSRVRDLARNDGWASGAITRILDNAVGANFHPIPKPDHRALAVYSGLKGFDGQWAYEYGQALAACYRTWAYDMGRYCDLQRANTVPQMMRLAFRHKLLDGDALGMLHWKADRLGPGRASYATALQLIDPDRLSNPQMQFDQQLMRGGVEVDADDVARAYWIRCAHQGDWFSAAKSVRWERVARETDWGRPIIVHDFDSDRAPQHRGGAGVLTPVVQRLKMLSKYDSAELDSAILNAVFSAYIESPLDHELMAEAMSDGPVTGMDGGLNAYQQDRAGFHDETRITIGGAKMPLLYPGEKINTVDGQRPSGNFATFEKAMLRNVAAAAGLSAQQVSNDWSDVNYSSARGAMLEFWKTMTRRRDDFAAGFSQPVFAAFVEEAMDVDDLPLPAGAPEFIECRSAYARAKWIGPGRGWIDPVNEVKGAVLGMDAVLMDYDEICAEQGFDGDDMISARANIMRRFKDAGVPLPNWSNMNPMGEPAQRTIADPEAT